MGCDIHSFAEKRNKQTNKWEKVKGKHPFNWRNYSVFAFLAGVRNYDHCEPLAEPKGIPKDVCEEIRIEYEGWEYDAHSASYFTAKELSDFDYEKKFWNRRISRTFVMANGLKFTDGAATAGEGEGMVITYRENLKESFFTDLEELKSLGEPEDVRIVFWFDN